MPKYLPLVDFLKNLTVNSYNLSFEEIEKILGEKLTDMQKVEDAWWANNPSHPLMKEILEAGCKEGKTGTKTG